MSQVPREQIARNQAARRTINDAIRDGRRAAPGGGRLFLCECGGMGCSELLAVTLDEYDAVRAHPDRFVVLPGHVVDGVDQPVDRCASGVVVVEVSSRAA